MNFFLEIQKLLIEIDFSHIKISAKVNGGDCCKRSEWADFCQNIIAIPNSGFGLKKMFTLKHWTSTSMIYETRRGTR